jgi:hypothetical protein
MRLDLRMVNRRSLAKKAKTAKTAKAAKAAQMVRAALMMDPTLSLAMRLVRRMVNRPSPAMRLGLRTVDRLSLAKKAKTAKAALRMAPALSLKMKLGLRMVSRPSLAKKAKTAKAAQMSKAALRMAPTLSLEMKLGLRMVSRPSLAKKVKTGIAAPRMVLTLRLAMRLALKPLAKMVPRTAQKTVQTQVKKTLPMVNRPSLVKQEKTVRAATLAKKARVDPRTARTPRPMMRLAEKIAPRTVRKMVLKTVKKMGPTATLLSPAKQEKTAKAARLARLAKKASVEPRMARTPKSVMNLAMKPLAKASPVTAQGMVQRTVPTVSYLSRAKQEMTAKRGRRAMKARASRSASPATSALLARMRPAMTMAVLT